MERSHRLKSESDHAGAYKRRSGAGIDKKMMRLHQRSVAQQSKRDAKVGQHRKIGCLSPLKEVQQNVEKVDATAMSRKERLEKWRQEKLLKKKLEARENANKKLFKVQHVKETSAPSFSAIDKKTTKVGPQHVKETTAPSFSAIDKKTTKIRSSTSVTKAPAASNARITRKSARLEAQSKKVEITKKVTAPRVTRTEAKSVGKKEQAPKVKKGGVSNSLKPDEKVSANLMTSFAPTDFTFTAPGNLSSFIFKPLSPSAAASFLLPSQESGSYLASPAPRRCSTPKMRHKQRRTPSTMTQSSSDSKQSGRKSGNLMSSSSSENEEKTKSTGKAKHGRRASPPKETETGTNHNSENVEVAPEESKLEEMDVDHENQKLNSMKENVPAVFKTPVSAPRQSLPRSSNKRQLNSVVRTPKVAMKFQTMSPEEKMEVITHSPMVETRRRTPKLVSPVKAIAPLPDFNDIPCEDDRPIPMDMGDDGQPQIAASEVGETSDEKEGKSEKHDVLYFRNLVITERARLNCICDKWDKTLEETSQLTEDVSGQIRTTVGQAHLLMNQRFKQFTGLVDNCEFGTGEKETHCSDLQGFWDMIYYQVEDVDKKFADLDMLKAKNWVKEQPKKVVKKKKAVIKPAATKTVAKSKFAAFRAQMMKQKQTTSPIKQTTSPIKQTASAIKPTIHVEPVEVKTFEAPGFFKVSSPVRSPKPHCEGTPARDSPLRKAVLVRSARKSIGGLSPAVKLISRRSCGTSPLLKTALATLSASRGSLTNETSCKASPLLTDATPRSRRRSAKGAAINTPLRTPISTFEGQSIFTPDSLEGACNTRVPRNSQMATRTVDFLTEDKDVQDTTPAPADDFFSKYLMPSSSNASSSETAISEDMTVRKETDPLRGIRRTPKGASAIMKTPKSATRKSRRSVHFLNSPTPQRQTSAARVPRTPFNFDRLDCEKPSTPLPILLDVNTESLFTPPTQTEDITTITPTQTAKLANLTIHSTPGLNSLLFSPQISSNQTEGADEMTDLMCFSPLAATNTRRSVRLSRQSVNNHSDDLL